MPAFSTHYLFAREMLPVLEEAAKPFELHVPSVFLGTQGPDVFLFHRLLFLGKSYRRISSRMHRMRPSLLFEELARQVNSAPCRSIALSYAYGFLCHYALDCTVHPFVYARQAELKKKYKVFAGFTLHNRIEFGLDAVLLHDKLGVEHPRRFETQALLSQEPQLLEAVCGILEKVIGAVLPELPVRREKLLEAWRDFYQMQRVLHDKGGWRRPALQVAETVLLPFTLGFCPSSMLRPSSAEKARIRYCNTEHKPWSSPEAPHRMRSESFDELWEEAKVLTSRLLGAFQLEMEGNPSMKAATEDRSFLTGEPVKE